MQLTKTTIFFVSIIGLASATLDVDAKRAEIRARELEDIKTKRACVSNGCKCNKVKQGQYCGLCDAVINAGSGSWLDIFECSPTGSCCDYGASTHCAGDSAQTWCPK